jgi:hypothetical protein
MAEQKVQIIFIYSKTNISSSTCISRYNLLEHIMPSTILATLNKNKVNRLFLQVSKIALHLCQFFYLESYNRKKIIMNIYMTRHMSVKQKYFLFYTSRLNYCIDLMQYYVTLVCKMTFSLQL